MDFQQVCQVFGGGIFPEEYRGNLKALTYVYPWIDAKVEDLRPSVLGGEDSNDPLAEDKRACRLLLRGIWQALSGNYATAIALISRLISFVQSSETIERRWQLRAFAYRLLFRSWAEYPPHFRFCDLSDCPSRMTCGGDSVTDEMERRDASEEYDACLASVQYGVGLDFAEFSLIVAVTNLPAAIGMTLMQTATGATNGAEPDDEPNGEAEEADEEDIGPVQLFQISAQQAQSHFDAAGLVQASAYVDRLRYEFARRTADLSNITHLAAMQSKYEASEDIHGLGICQLLRGDIAFSPAYTSPLALNLIICDGWDTFSGLSHSFDPLCLRQSIIQRLEGYWKIQGRAVPFTEELLALASNPAPETLESEMKEKLDLDSSTSTAVEPSLLYNAYSYYRRARKYFRKATSPIGFAAAMMREACAMLTMSILENSYNRVRDHSFPLEMLWRARWLFEASGDHLGAMLAATHLMVTLRYSHLEDEIGQWASESSNEIFGLHLGLLAMRVALHLRFMKLQVVDCDVLLELAGRLLTVAAPKSSIIFTIYMIRTECQALLGNYHKALLLHEQLLHRHYWDFQRRFYWPAKFVEEVEKNPLLFQARIIAHQNALKRVCEVAMSLLPHVTRHRDFLELVVSQLVQEVARYADLPFLNASTVAWIALQNRQLAFSNAYVQVQWLKSEPLPSDEKTMLLMSITSTLSQHTDPMGKLSFVQFLLEVENLQLATQVLSTIPDITPALDDVPEGVLSEQLYGQRYLESREMLLDIYIQTRSWNKAAHIMNEIELRVPGYFTTGQAYTAVPIWTRFLWAGLVMEGLEAPSIAVRFFEQARELYRISQHNRQVQAMTSHRLVSLETGSIRLVNAYARVLFKVRDGGMYESYLNQLQTAPINLQIFPLFGYPRYFMSGDIGADALVAFEHSRTSMYNELESWPVDVDRTQLMKDQYKLQLFEEMLLLVRDTSVAENAELEQLREEAEGFYSRLSEANATRDWGKMVWPHKRHIWKDLIESGRLSGTLVINISVDASGLALMALSEDGIEHADFNTEVTLSRVQQHIEICKFAFTHSQGQTPLDETGAESILTLSEWMLKPLQKAIEKSEHVVFILSGDLTQFPMGTLLHNNIYLGWQKAVSQVPSIYALLALTERSERPSRNSEIFFIPIAKPGDPVKHALSRDADREDLLPMAGIEAMILASQFGRAPLNAANLTRDEFLYLLEAADWLHLATHGEMDPDAPLLSWISLAERVRAIDFLSIQTGARLVVFSACLSGTGRAADRGDVLGFSHAVLAAGARAFMGALWPINDLTTLVHMIFFYQGILNNEERLSISQLWQRATASLAMVGTEAAGFSTADVFQTLIETWDRLEQIGADPHRFVRGGKRRLTDFRDKALNGELSIDWSHPYYWAPFTIIGDGRQVIDITGRPAESQAQPTEGQEN